MIIRALTWLESWEAAALVVDVISWITDRVISVRDQELIASAIYDESRKGQE